LGYIIPLLGPECWEGVSAMAQNSFGESINGPDAVPVLIHHIAAMNLLFSGRRF
jgi:hypothetical protein